MQLRFIILHKINPLVYKRLSLLNVTMVILGLVMFFLGGCADNHQKNELTSPFSLDLTNVPYSPELQPYLEAGWYSLSNPTDGVDSSMVNQLQTYDEFISTLMRPNPSNDDVDRFFELWKSEPSNVLWAGIAKSSRKYVQRGNEYRTMLAHPSVNDTTTAIGLYFWSSTNRSRSERLTGFRRVISRRSELSEFASIWVALRLSYLENKTGNKDKAVKDLLGELSSARQLGGNCLEMFFWRRLATIFLEQKHFDDALHAAVLAETMARRGDMPSLRLRFSQLIAKILEKHGELEVALKIHSKIIAEADSLDFPRQKSYSAEAAGMINAHQGNFEAALHFSRTSLGFHLDIGDSLNVPRVLMAIADNHRLAGSLDSCLVYQEKARLWVDAYPHPDNRAQLPIEMAQYYMQVGNYSVVDSLLAAAQRQLPANAPANLGAKIYMANFRTAMEAGRPAEAYKLLDGFEKIRNGVINLPLEVDLLSDLETTTTDFLASQGEFHLAQESLERARNLEVSSEYQLWLQEWSAGKLAFLRGDLNAALFSFEKCLTMAQEADDPDRVATTRFFLGQFYLAISNFSEAQKMFQPDPNNPGFGENFRIELASQINLARTWNQMGDPHQALISCTAATEAGQGRIPFDLSIELETQRGCNQVAVGQVKQGEASFIKALTLLHETGSLAPIGQGRIFSKDARHELLEEMIGLYADHPQLLPAGSLGLRTILLAEQGRWSADHKTRIEDLDSLEPLIEKVKGPLLVFFLGKDRSFSWLVNDGQIKLHEIAGRDEIIKNMRIFLAGATHAEEPINTLASQWLSVNLLGSAMRAWPNGETLNIVPDGVLFSTPWAALPLPDQTESTLVLDYGSIIQNPSVRTFVGHSQSRRDSPKPGSGALVSIGVDGISVGNDLDNNLPPLPDLRHAETEARAIADLWPEPNTALLLGKNATWEKINGLDLSGFQAIHLATHSVIKQGLPGRSTLRLADGKNGEPLTVHHITDLDLQADLVFLSSCSSARMLSGTGGIVNFARAFLTSGAGAVIGPTIRINDEAAHQLATRFYKNWLAGENKADALRGAQISLRSDARWSHPYYWGFYRIIGDGR